MRLQLRATSFLNSEILFPIYLNYVVVVVLSWIRLRASSGSELHLNQIQGSPGRSAVRVCVRACTQAENF
jgi:hypothetical protein